MVVRGFGASVLVLLGGLVVYVVPASSAFARWSVAADVRGSDVGYVAGVVLVWGGVLLLASQWVRLVRTAHAAGDQALGLVRRATFVWALPLLVAPPLFSRDGWSYAAQGDLLRHGYSPYEVGTGVLSGPILEGVDTKWYDTITPYGPLPLWLGSLAARVTENPWALVVFHRLLAVLGLALLAWAVPRLAAWGGVGPAWASAVVLASPLVLGTGVGGLHNDLLQVGLMAAALVVGVERGWAYGAVLAGLAAAVKAPGGLVAVGIVLATLPAGVGLATRVGRLVVVGAVALATLFGLGLVTGVGAGWVHALSVPGAVTTPLSVTTLLGGSADLLLGWPFPGLPDHLLRDGLRDVGTALGVLTAVVVALRWRTGDRRAALAATAAVVGAVVVTSPVVQPWYLLWLVPFVLCLRLSRLWTTVAVCAVGVLGANAAIDGVVQRLYFAVAVLVLLGVLVLGAHLLTRAGRERVRRWDDLPWLRDDGLPGRGEAPRGVYETPGS